MDASPCRGLVINAPDIFTDPAFQAWLTDDRPKFTWHRDGPVGEYSDVVVLVDPGLTGEGSDSDMPEHIWDRIINACIDHLGAAYRSQHHYMVRWPTSRPDHPTSLFQKDSRMLQTSRRDHAQLLARARAALETPTELDAGAITHLIEDLSAAEGLVKGHMVPWAIDIHVAEIDHRHGSNIYVALTREALMSQIGGYCREWWHETDDPRDPATLSDEDISFLYFALVQDEYLTTDRIACAPTEERKEEEAIEDPGRASAAGPSRWQISDQDLQATRPGSDEPVLFLGAANHVPPTAL